MSISCGHINRTYESEGELFEPFVFVDLLFREQIWCSQSVHDKGHHKTPPTIQLNKPTIKGPEDVPYCDLRVGQVLSQDSDTCRGAHEAQIVLEDQAEKDEEGLGMRISNKYPTISPYGTRFHSPSRACPTRRQG